MTEHRRTSSELLHDGSEEEIPSFLPPSPKQTVITLNDSDRDWFLALLESDDEPNEELKKAAELYRKGKREGETYRW